MNERQLADYVTKKLHDNPGTALDAYYNAKDDKWAAVSTDSGMPRDYKYMGTYTSDGSGRIEYQPR